MTSGTFSFHLKILPNLQNTSKNTTKQNNMRHTLNTTYSDLLTVLVSCDYCNELPQTTGYSLEVLQAQCPKMTWHYWATLFLKAPREIRSTLS